MKKVIRGNWTPGRFLRLGFGLVIIVHSVMTGNWTLVLLGIGFTALALLNIGCCGTASCTRPVKVIPGTKKDITHEEGS